MKSIIGKLYHKALQIALKDLYQRVGTVEYRNFNRRYYAIEQIAEYLLGAEIPGDYLEFGVWRGATFAHAYKMMAPLFPEMRFLAFDSFQGLPKPKGLDALEGHSSRFNAQDFQCGRSDFIEAITVNGVSLERVRMVEGWFDATLNHQTAVNLPMREIAAAWIDCDLYESTRPILPFITPYLRTGSVIAFDDWRCFRNHPDFGEQRACREWLADNPQIKLNPLFSFGWNGAVFTLQFDS